MAGSWMMRIGFLHQQERIPSALIDYSTFYFLICRQSINNQLFWEGVQEAFTSHSELSDNLLFEDEVHSDLHHINFKKIVFHDWKKLRMIWKNLKSEYKAALSSHTMSGTHSSNFYKWYPIQHHCFNLQGKMLANKLNLN